MLHSVSRTLWTVESRLCWLCCSPQLLSPLPGKTLPKAKSGHTKDTVGNNVPWRANNLQACTPFLMEEESVLYGVVFGWKRNLHTVSPPLHMVACPCWAVSQSLCSSFNYDVLSLLILYYSYTNTVNLFLRLWCDFLSSAPLDTGYSESECRRDDILMLRTAGSNPNSSHCYQKKPSSLLPSHNFWDPF